MGLGTSTINYSFSYFLPIILNQSLKFDTVLSQILVAPPYGFAAIYMFGINYLGDKYKYRGPVILLNMVICLVGIPILGWHSQPYVRYFGSFLICAGANANLPSVLALQGNNIRGQWKRAFCSAIFVGLAGLGGIVGALVFREQDKLTGYRPGLYACITAALLVMVLTIACDISYWKGNQAADRGEKHLECDEVSRSPHKPISCWTFTNERTTNRTSLKRITDTLYKLPNFEVARLDVSFLHCGWLTGTLPLIVSHP